jgi:hypothetical protein
MGSTFNYRSQIQKGYKVNWNSTAFFCQNIIALMFYFRFKIFTLDSEII